MSLFENDIEGLVYEINKKNADDLEDYRELYFEIKNDANKIKELIVEKLPQPNIENIKSTILTVDGSNYQENFDSISISLATAYVYLTNGYIERYLPRIAFIPPYYSNLVNSILMKELEYRITFNLLNDPIIKEKPDLVLFDGTLTFPDLALGKYANRSPTIMNAYNEYIETSNKLFSYLKDYDIPTMAVIKDSHSNKFFYSLYQSLIKKMDNYEFSLDSIKEIEKYILKWGKKGKYNSISELIMIKNLLEEDFIRTKFVEVSRALRSEIPIDLLKGNVYGSYVKVNLNQKPFFIEIPGFSMKNKDKMLEIFSSMGFFTIRAGYPMPLLAAHNRAKMSKIRGQSIIRLIKNVFESKTPELYGIINELFRESV